MRNLTKTWGLILTASLLVVSCKVTQTYQKPEVPQEELSRIYGEFGSKDSLSTAKIPLNQIFTDPDLQQVIAQVLANNFDLKTAILRIQQADAIFKQSKLAYYPNLTGGPSVSVNKQSKASLSNPQIPSNPQTNFALGINTGWEINFWGELGAAKRAAYANLLSTDAAKRAVQTQLVAQAATLYYQLLALDEQLNITNQTIKLRADQVETVKALKESAVLTGADVANSEANLYAAQVSVPDLKMSIRQIQDALSALMGETPTTIKRGTLKDQMVYTDLKTGVPSQLLQNRPDIQAAQFAFEQAFELHNVAKADMFPSFSITGALGLSSRKIKDLFTNSLTYSVGAALNQTIFGLGTKRTQLKISELQQQQAFIAYQKSVIDASQEVSDAMYSFESADEKSAVRKLQIETLERAVDFNMELLKYSSNTNFTDVLSAEQNLLAAQLSGVNDRLQALLAVVSFYQAIGGGQF